MTMQLKNMMTVDGVPVLIEGERNLLEVISKVGTIMPVFCYHSYLSIYGACRMCMVEDDRGRLMAACSTLPEPGMKIRTNTGRWVDVGARLLHPPTEIPVGILTAFMGAPMFLWMIKVRRYEFK